MDQDKPGEDSTAISRVRDTLGCHQKMSGWLEPAQLAESLLPAVVLKSEFPGRKKQQIFNHKIKGEKTLDFARRAKSLHTPCDL